MRGVSSATTLPALEVLRKFVTAVTNAMSSAIDAIARLSCALSDHNRTPYTLHEA